MRRVAVFLDEERRDRFAADVTGDIVIPALMILPLMAIILAWAIRRGLLPLQQLSTNIQALDIDAGKNLEPQQPYQELGITVHAINSLVQRLNTQITRERRFTADVAHELRTPLTSLVLQARLARETSAQAQQALALQTLEQDSLRAGRILSQLLDLTRAQSVSGDVTELVDLCALARRVVSEHAALAHDLGSSIALEVPQSPVAVRGNTTLLELAVRNLVDNALRHNPNGTAVEVSVNIDKTGASLLAVSDDGSEQESHDPLHQPHPSRRQGLGIGLTLVERIAQSQRTQLKREAGTAPFIKRYSLIWHPTFES